MKWFFVVLLLTLMLGWVLLQLSLPGCEYVRECPEHYNRGERP